MHIESKPYYPSLAHITAVGIYTALIMNSSICSAGEYQMGLGVGVSTAVYDEKKEVNVAPVPYLAYEGERFSVSLDEISYKILNNDEMSLAITASGRSTDFDVKDAKKNKALAGIKERDGTIDMGISLEMNGLYLSAKHDVGGKYKGYEINTGASIPLPVGKWVIAPNAGINVMSAELVGYNYGVKEAERTTTRAAYKGKSTVSPYVGVTAMYPINKKLGLLMATEYKKLGKGITDSPITFKKHESSAMAGLVYNF